MLNIASRRSLATLLCFVFSLQATAHTSEQIHSIAESRFNRLDWSKTSLIGAAREVFYGFSSEETLDFISWAPIPSVVKDRLLAKAKAFADKVKSGEKVDLLSMAWDTQEGVQLAGNPFIIVGFILVVLAAVYVLFIPKPAPQEPAEPNHDSMHDIPAGFGGSSNIHLPHEDLDFVRGR